MRKNNYPTQHQYIVQACAFLHFYEEPPPVAFIKAQYHQQWERHRPEAEAVEQWTRAESRKI